MASAVSQKNVFREISIFFLDGFKHNNKYFLKQAPEISKTDPDVQLTSALINSENPGTVLAPVLRLNESCR